MLDFPNSPSPGDYFPSPPIAGRPRWRWDGEKWTDANSVPFDEAPQDGRAWARRNGVWSEVLPIDGGTLLGDLILNRDPIAALQAATKQYVDGTTNTDVGGIGVGYMRLPNGMIFQWGNITVPNDAWILFPTVFPSICVFVGIQAFASPNTNQTMTMPVREAYTYGFVPQPRFIEFTGQISVLPSASLWLALGY